MSLSLLLAWCCPGDPSLVSNDPWEGEPLTLVWGLWEGRKAEAAGVLSAKLVWQVKICWVKLSESVRTSGCSRNTLCPCELLASVTSKFWAADANV